MCRTVTSESAGSLGVDVEVFERRGLRIESIEGVRAADPDRPGVVLEQREDVYARKAPRVLVVIGEDFEVVAVVTIQAVLGAEPDESQVVLDDFVDPGL